MTTESRAAFPRIFTLALVALAPLATGCASRAVPFDALDKAQVTIYRIQTPPPAPAAPTLATPSNPVAPFLQQLGVTPEMQKQADDMLKQLQQMGIPPLTPLPGMTPTPSSPAPQQPQLPLLRNQWQILDQRVVMDDNTREQLLDLFGNAESFNAQPARCWTPGLAVSFVDPSKPEPVDVVLSLSCAAANGFGFVWPHANNYTLQPKAQQQLTQLYQTFFGPVPPQGI